MIFIENFAVVCEMGHDENRKCLSFHNQCNKDSKINDI